MNETKRYSIAKTEGGCGLCESGVGFSGGREKACGNGGKWLSRCRSAACKVG